MRRRVVCFCLAALMCLSFSTVQAEGVLNWLSQAAGDVGSWVSDAVEDTGEWIGNAAEDVGDWVSNAVEDTGKWIGNAAEDVGNWVSHAAQDTGNWVSNAATDAWSWTAQAGTDAWNWTAQAGTDAWNWTVTAANNTAGWTVSTATNAWNGIAGFFSPPSTKGNPNVPKEPDLPDNTLKMYLGYSAVKTGLDNGYHNELEMTNSDPHFGITLGKFYISGFSRVISLDGKGFIFLKNVGDEVQLHFELVEDIDMINGDTYITIEKNPNGYDRQMGVTSTDFGRGTLIVRVTDYQNNPGEPQVYRDYLAAKMTGSADTVISLNEEGDYEVALDYKIKKRSRILDTALEYPPIYGDYRIHFKFSVRNGNCMVFPFDLQTGDELLHTSVTKNGFRLDLARSRYLNINVKYSRLTEGAAGVVEDIRFNRPARDGDIYNQEGIYTITAQNQYTGLETVKTLYVGEDPKLIDYINKGETVEQIIEEVNHD